MRASQIINSNKKTDPISKSRSRSKSISGIQIQNKFYFCHYKNAMYMGGIKSFNKNGRGILIHDNGASVVCNYYNDFKHGHNITYYENCLMSTFYDKNKIVENVIRLPNYLLYVRYNKQCQIDGKGILIDYQNRNITYLTYKKNILINKRQENQYNVINRIFQLENLEFLIGITHSKALKHQLEDIQNISVIKSGSKLSIGYAKRGLLNGLGFILNTKQPGDASTSKHHNILFLKLIERGYFQNSQLTGMGQKWFKNGNLYIGDFKDNIFEGRGVLKNKEKNNWVHGCFSKGNMSQMIQYSNQGDLLKFNKIVQIMHERKSSWINNQIHLQNPQIYQKQIQKILNNKPIENIKSLQIRKQQVLRKIQDNFICQDPHTSITFPPDQRYLSNQRINLHQVQNSFESSKLSNVFQSPNSKNNQNYDKKYVKNQKTTAKSIYNIKILQATNKDENSQLKQSFFISPIKQNRNAKSKIKTADRSMGFSQIKDQSQTAKLDSKRLIGRSRLFKYTPNEQQQPPNFRYNEDKQSKQIY